MKYRQRKPKQRELHDASRGASDNCSCGFDNHVAWWWPYCIVAFAIMSRFWYVTSMESWWILHPDEIYQITEVAFSEVYGYGFRPYEYLPKPTHVVTSAENHTFRTGMFGLRSFLIPDMFAGVLLLESLVGGGSSPLVICKIFNVMVTSTLPMSVFTFVNRIFSCRLLAVIASALSAVELHLVVFGTHSLVNSFTSTFVFFSLAYLVHNDVKTELLSESWKGNVPKGHSQIETSQESETSAHAFSQVREYVFGTVRRLSKDKNNNSDLKKKASIPVSFNSRSAKSETPSSVYDHKRSPEMLEKVLAGFVMGALCYVRADTLLFSSVLLFVTSLATTISLKRLAFNAMYSCFGFLCSCALCAMYDYLRYGAYVISPLQWLHFNVLSGKAITLFDSQLNTSYITEFYRDPLGVILCALCVLYVVTASLKLRIQQPDVSTCINARLRQELAVSASFLLILLVFSVIGHREMRFIHNCFVLYSIVIAFVIHRVAAEYRTHPKAVQATILFLYVILSVNTFVNFPWMQTEEHQRWTYGIPRESFDLNQCIDSIRRQGDVTGVVIDGDIYDIGGFSVLKHDVPLIVKTYHEYFVYNKRKTNVFEISSSVRILNFFDDIFHESNTQYLVESVVSNTHFNYIISKHITTTLSPFFKQISQYGQFGVYKRTYNKAQLPTGSFKTR
ncbi:uncharacterized protein LOC127854467 [Dreissena polymorpha]|uniref:Mannosyltransferase n=1 Tax=Dreissena polymorpha TaxID=45954 RepID=A0A9D4NBH8_DREPO|nr:uncharacterized protein LOC127854467 [Dreissena polymorpha]KAH3891311.1 hypothetical protein DPMN_015405 [Dreissena polymorpha]